MSRGDGFDHLYAAVGERVVRARKAAGLSQEKLAKKVGITRASIVNIERGRQRAPIHVLWRIAEALEVEPAKFIPLKTELAARNAPVQLSAEVIAYIESKAQDDPATKRLLTEFIEKATSKIERKDGKSEE